MSRLPPAVQEPSHWLMGPAWHAQRDPIGYITRWAAEYGDVFSISSPLGSATVVADPVLARQVLADHYPNYVEKGRSYAVLRILMGNGLVTSSGEFWRGQRKMTQPAFHRRRLDAIFAMMVRRSREAAVEMAGAGGAPDIAPAFSRLTLAIISEAMFSTDVKQDASTVGAHVATLNEAALRMLRQPWRFLLPRRFPTPFTRHDYHARTELDRIVNNIIHQRRRNPDGHDDLLSMFLSACDEETGRGMTDGQLRDEVMTMFIAGHETTANAMCWVFHLLATHPDAKARLLEEITAAGDALDQGNLSAFPYTKMVIEESLRLYPTIWSVGRLCTRDDELGDWKIRKGDTLIIPIFHFQWSAKCGTSPQSSTLTDSSPPSVRPRKSIFPSVPDRAPASAINSPCRN